MMLTIILSALLAISPVEDTTNVLFWNLENFFDYKDGKSSASDTEFSSKGDKHWTKQRFTAKCNAVAKSILYLDHLPELIGVAEIENRFVLERLVKGTALRKLDYKVIHYESPDHRGIDVGLLYKADRIQLLSSKVIRIDTLATRDILLAEFLINNQKTAVLVNHHPSKVGGAAAVWKREYVVGRLKAVCDSLSLAGVNNIIAMGDFNETPENSLFDKLPLVNLAKPLAEKGEGTIRYKGKWELIDNFFVSKCLESSQMSIITLPFLQSWDNSHSGYRPMRTYTGPKYNGGVSDHKPILLKCFID